MFHAGGLLHDFNTIDSIITNYINKFRSCNKKTKYVYSLAGGFIANRMTLLSVLTNDWKKHITYALTNFQNDNPEGYNELSSGDAFLSYLFYINGYDIEDWNELAEIHLENQQYKILFTRISIIHGFKYFYSNKS